MACLAEIFILILEGIIKKISYERRDYESLDEKSRSYGMSRKTTKRKKNSGSIYRGLNSETHQTAL